MLWEYQFIIDKVYLKNLSNLRILDLGIKPYEEVWLYQKKLQKQRINNHINDTLILVEHYPVYTL